jgi:hypothetical protein
MLLGFKDQFHPMILDGSKRHTIRAQRKIRPKPGETCHCYGKVRQKGMHLLGRWPCVRVSEIVFTPVLAPGCICRGDGLMGMRCDASVHAPDAINEQVVVTIDGEALSLDELDLLAWRDGFRTQPGAFPDSTDWYQTFGAFELMLRFWHAEKRLLDGKPWVGDIIYWDFDNPVKL